MKKIILIFGIVLLSLAGFSQRTYYQTDADLFSAWFQRDIAEAGSYPLVIMDNLNATNTKPTLQISNLGNGACILVDTADKATSASVSIGFETINYGFYRNLNTMYWTINGGDVISVGTGDVSIDGDVEMLGDITIGEGVAGKDYIISVVGESNTGTMTYMEDEDRFDFDNDVDVIGDLTAGTFNGVTISEVANTVELTKGTSHVALTAGSTLDVDGATDISGNLVVNNNFTVGTTNAGTLDYTAAGKTLNVEGNSTVNQDLTTDAGVQFLTVLATTSATLGDDVLNTSGQLNLIASDNDQGNVAITTDDYLTFNGFTRYVFDNDASFPALKKIYFGLGDNTWIDEMAAENMRVAVGGSQGLGILSDGIYLSSTDKVRYGGSTSDTYDLESAADIKDTYVGGLLAMRIVENTYVAMHLPETTTPTAVANYGAIYPKADNNLYFQDGAGTEHELATVDDHYGEMYMYESAGSQTVGQTAQYYAINSVFSVGDISNDWSFVAGSNGGGNITTAGGGAAINIADVSHGLISGDYVNVQSANHTGTSIVTYVDDDNFTVAIAFVGNEAGTWQEGDYLLAGSGSAGKYLLNISITAAAGAASKEYKFEAVINSTHQDKAAFEIMTSGTKHQSSSGICIATIAVGDRVWCQFKNETDTEDLNYEHGNITITRL